MYRSHLVYFKGLNYIRLRLTYKKDLVIKRLSYRREKALIVEPVEEKEGERKAEPDADESQLLDVVRQQIVDNFKA